MKFYGTGHIWDNEKQRVAVSFGKGSEVDVTDERIIQLLIKKGLKPEREYIDVEYEEVIDFESMTKNQLKDYIKANVSDLPKGWHSKSKENLIKLIEG